MSTKHFYLCTKILKGSTTIAPEENCAPTPKLSLGQTLTLTRGGKFSSGAIIWLSPNPKTNSDLDINHNPNRGAIFLGGNCPDTEFPEFSSSEKVQFTFYTK